MDIDKTITKLDKDYNMVGNPGKYLKDIYEKIKNLEIKINKLEALNDFTNKL